MRAVPAGTWERAVYSEADALGTRVILHRTCTHPNGFDVARLIYEHLDLASLQAMCRASRFFCQVGHEERVWGPQCDRLWEDKVHIPAGCRELRGQGRHREACVRSLRDGQRRHITPEELCRYEWAARIRAFPSTGAGTTRRMQQLSCSTGGSRRETIGGRAARHASHSIGAMDRSGHRRRASFGPWERGASFTIVVGIPTITTAQW
jgi:hypothetical protein